MLLSGNAEKIDQKKNKNVSFAYFCVRRLQILKFF